MQFLKHSLWCLLVPGLALAALSPVEILKQVDQVRNPAESYQMRVEVLSGEGTQDQSLFEVFIQGGHKTLIKTLSPLRDRGRNLLMIDENMWAFIPNLKRSVRVGLSQKLTGQAANGDLSRMRWSGDYEPRIENKTKNEWVLFLTAKRKGLTYDKIRVWVDQKSLFPRKAEFLSLDGKKLKTGWYEEDRKLAGSLRPSVMRIQDSIRSDEVTVIRVKEMVVKEFPASFMNQNSLR